MKKFILVGLVLLAVSLNCQITSADETTPFKDDLEQEIVQQPEQNSDSLNEQWGQLAPSDDIYVEEEWRSHHRYRHEFRCYAENPYRTFFWATAHSPQLAQERAIGLCMQAPPHVCKPLGCQGR